MNGWAPVAILHSIREVPYYTVTNTMWQFNIKNVLVYIFDFPGQIYLKILYYPLCPRKYSKNSNILASKLYLLDYLIHSQPDQKNLLSNHKSWVFLVRKHGHLSIKLGFPPTIIIFWIMASIFRWFWIFKAISLNSFGSLHSLHCFFLECCNFTL